MIFVDLLMHNMKQIEVSMISSQERQ